MSRNVQFGYLLPSRENAVLGDLDAAPLLALAERAEAAGFDSVWVSDSPLGRTRLDGLALLAAVAARTRVATVGTSVLVAALRNPVLLAAELASIERLAPGRVTIGVGTGFPGPAADAQYRALSVDPTRRLGRLRDTVGICRALWSAEGPLRVATEFHTVDTPVSLDGLTPSTSDGPPFWLGGASRTAQSMVARSFDGWMPYVQHAGEYASGLARIRDRATELGRDPRGISAAFVPTVLIDGHLPAGQRRFADYCARYYGAEPDAVIRNRPGFFVGPAEGCLDWLSGFIDAGVSQLIFRVAALDGTADELRRIAESVVAPLRHAYPAEKE